jgi:hypothetical protein
MIETCGKDKSERVWNFRSKYKKRFQPKVIDPINTWEFKLDFLILSIYQTSWFGKPSSTPYQLDGNNKRTREPHQPISSV